MEKREDDPEKNKILRQLLFIIVIMLIGMTIYEALKQFIFPNITIWQSHTVTIIFSTVCASVASFSIFRKLNVLNNELASQNIESELLKKDLEKTVGILEAKISEIKTLTGLLPICSSCKKIRDDKGCWSKIESYIQEHSEVDFSHGICPECAKKLYPEFY